MGLCGVPWAPLTTALVTRAGEGSPQASLGAAAVRGERAGSASPVRFLLRVATHRARPSPTPSGRRGHRPGFHRLGGPLPLPVGGPAALPGLGGSCLLFAGASGVGRVDCRC